MYRFQDIGLPCSSHHFESIEMAVDVSGWMARRLTSVENVILVCTDRLYRVFYHGESQGKDENDQRVYLASTILKGFSKTSTGPLIIPVVRTKEDMKYVPELYKHKKCFQLWTDWEALVRLTNRVQDYDKPLLKDCVYSFSTAESNQDERDASLS